MTSPLRATRLLDVALSATGAILATVSAGLSINATDVATFFAVGIAALTLVSFGVSRLLEGTKLHAYDGAFYAAGAAGCIGFALQLNEALPGTGYPRALLVASVLSWMLLVGSLFAWRDPTLLFQAVPSIALFGLVGAWDTFKSSPILFFMFLLCASTLFARAHVRSMAAQAERAGFADSSRLPLGPWRWMAGPEWALASAAVVVLLSVVGAPLIQQGVGGVAGAVSITIPTRPTPTTTGTRFGGEAGNQAVGRGPTSIGENPVLIAFLDQPRYLRGQTYAVYTGRSWAATKRTRFPAPATGPSSLTRFYDPNDFIRPAREVTFGLRVLSGVHARAYTPGEAWLVPERVDGNAFGVLADGTVVPRNPLQRGSTFNGTALVPAESAKPGRAGEPPAGIAGSRRQYRDTENIPESVAEFAREAVRGASSDLERAEALKRAIEGRVRYNLNARATPADRDPVEFFLFDSREGYCDLFASAMALTARSVGLPSRWVSGFYPNRPPREPNVYIVRSADYHAWCEIFFEGVGWIPFDPTEGAVAVPGGERGAVPVSNEAFWQKEWFRILLDGGLIAVVVGLIGVTILGLVRSRAIASDAPSDRRPAHRLYRRFERAVRGLAGRPRRLNDTAAEYVARVEVPPHLRSQAEDLARRFEDALYGPEPPTGEDLREIEEAMRRMRQAARSR